MNLTTRRKMINFSPANIINTQQDSHRSMGQRPKSSLAGIIGVGSGLYGGQKLSNIDRNFTHLTNAVAAQTVIQAAGFGAMIELQMGTLFAIREVSEGIATVNRQLSGIRDVMLRQERREEMVGDLKLIVLSIKKALDNIDTIKNDYTVWAAFETQVLLDIVDDNGIDNRQFKRLPPTEIEYVETVLQRLNSTHSKLMLSLERVN